MRTRWLIVGVVVTVAATFVLDWAGLHTTASAGLFVLGALIGYWTGVNRKVPHQPSDKEPPSRVHT